MKPLSLMILLAAAGLAGAQTNQTNSSAPEAANTAAPETNAVPTLQIDAGKVVGQSSPILYGLMTEEINFSYEGGLYAELVRNRSFKASKTEPLYWRAENAAISLDTNQPLNSALDVSLKLDTSKASATTPAGIINGGYWGIAVRPNTTYHLSFFAKAKDFNGSLTASLVHVVGSNHVTVASAPGTEVRPGKMTMPVATATIPRISGQWQKYEVTLTTPANLEPSKDNQLVISTTKAGTFFHRHGTIWFQQVSLFPPTYHNRPNGTRPDLMELLAAMHPKFLRFPGGNYLEGDTINERFNWKETIGPLEDRPGHRSPWNYWSTDGFGLLEFLDWCDDLQMQPVLAVFAGYALRHDHVNPGPDLQPYVQDALDEIEYVTGDTNTKWGAQRAKDGHPAPFELNYVEVGNEDWFDRSGSYDGRFAQFYDAIKAKYPRLQVIATARVKSRVPDLLDEHYYRSQEEMEVHALDYDKYPRDSKTKIFVGEWATRVGWPTPNMAGALGDAAWMTGMERNSDIVRISSYAPLFVNVSDLGRGGSMQWRTDLIGYDALNSYGSPAYYAQQMFSTHYGDEILATDSQNLPTREWQPRPRTRNGVPQGPPPAKEQMRQVFFDATRDSKSGVIYVKVVNETGASQSVKVQVSGASSIAPRGQAIILKAENPEDTNSLEDPKKIAPVTENVDGLGTDFTREFPPYSITVLELHSAAP